ERHDAGLSDPCPQASFDMNPPAALRRQVERSSRGYDLAQTRNFGHRLARGFVGLDVAMQARFGNLHHRDERAPRAAIGVALAGLVARLGHDLTHLRSAAAETSRTFRTA